MKFAWALLLLSLVLAAPQKRLFLDTFVDSTELRGLVTNLVHTAGSNETEKACEDQCHNYIKKDHILQYSCPLVCKSLQSLAHRFDIVTTSAPAS